MVNYMMSGVNRYCSTCMQMGEFLPLKFVMMNIDSGMWMCPKNECIFPMASKSVKDYIEDNLTSEKILMLTGKKSTEIEELPAMDSHNNTMVPFPSNSFVDSDSMKTASATSKNDTDSVTNTENQSISSLLSEALISKKASDIQVKDLMPFWENEGLLCWLDTILATVILNTTLKLLCTEQDSKHLISNFYEHHKKQISIFHAYKGDYSTIKETMISLRLTMLKVLQAKMLTNFSEDDSPFLAIQLMIKTNKKVHQEMEFDFESELSCSKCQFQKKDRFRNMILSLPSTPDDLDLGKRIYYTRPCYKCLDEEQRLTYNVLKYPKSLFVHFESGLRRSKFWKRLNFVTDDLQKYIVTEIVQYIEKKKHFVLWAFSYKDKLWIEVDDLKDPVVYPKYKYPKCKPREVHMMVWENVSVLKSCSNTGHIPNTATNVEVEFVDNDVGESNSRSSSLVAGDVDSAVTSRDASLCSLDGISPATSVILNRGASQQQKNEGTLKKQFLHVPRYKPYIPKFKQNTRKEEPTVCSNAEAEASTHSNSSTPNIHDTHAIITSNSSRNSDVNDDTVNNQNNSKLLCNNNGAQEQEPLSIELTQKESNVASLSSTITAELDNFYTELMRYQSSSKVTQKSENDNNTSNASNISSGLTLTTDVNNDSMALENLINNLPDSISQKDDDNSRASSPQQPDENMDIDQVSKSMSLKTGDHDFAFHSNHSNSSQQLSNLIQSKDSGLEISLAHLSNNHHNNKSQDIEGKALKNIIDFNVSNVVREITISDDDLDEILDGCF